VIAVGALLAQRFLPADQPPAGAPRARLDLIGLALLAGALAGTLVGLSNLSQDGGINHPGALGPLLAGLAVLGLFVAWALRPGNHKPIVNIRLLGFRSLGSASAVLFTAGGHVLRLVPAAALLPVAARRVGAGGGPAADPAGRGLAGRPVRDRQAGRALRRPSGHAHAE
jgi:hypothetical protein